jgi:hypothetical protein
MRELAKGLLLKEVPTLARDVDRHNVRGRVIEVLCVQEARVRLARFGAITSLPCIGGDRELLPSLVTHLKIFENLIEVMPKLIRSL